MSTVPDRSFVSFSPRSAVRSNSPLWQRARKGEPPRRDAAPRPSPMEEGVSILATFQEAPPRTSDSRALVRSSPLPPEVRAMLESRAFGRPFDAVPMDLDAAHDRLPALACPSGDVAFLACDDDLEALSFSVDGLLRHRKRLVSASVDPSMPRKRVLIVGAGPAGLMAAIQLRLRDHEVVVCEQREVYRRNRLIGVYKEVAHLMASLGMPERMTYDFSEYRGKRGIMLADIQTFLHGVALKLGVVIYMGAVARRIDAAALQRGEIELQCADTLGAAETSVGMVRWQHDTIARVRSGVMIRFDMIVEATGGRSGLRETLVGQGNVVQLRTLGRAAVAQDPTLDSFFADPEDHTAEYVESDYGCPPGMREAFAAAILSDGRDQIPDSLPCFVSNIDASIFTRPMERNDESPVLAWRIADRDLAIPHDWVVLECRLPDQSITRYHIEGPLPQTFEFGGKRLPTRDVLAKLSPVSLLLKILYAMGLPFDAVDRRRLVDFYNEESSSTDATDIVSTWVGGFRGLRLGGEKPIWCGTVPGNDAIEYAIIGEALQNAWYRFGVGVDDAFAGAMLLAQGMDLAGEARLFKARRFEHVMIARSVHILYHLFSVARNTEQGVVGQVLTEYYMDEQHGEDVADARLREASWQGAEMLAAACDVWTDDPDSLVDAALDHLREGCCQRVMSLLGEFSYPAEVLDRASLPMKVGDPQWRSHALETLEPALSSEHSELVARLFTSPAILLRGRTLSERPRAERLVELAMGRYAWVSPWLRASALRALDPESAAARGALEWAVNDPDPLVAETAAAKLGAASKAAGHTALDKVMVLQQVNLFRAIPHQVLAGVAALLTEQEAEPGERIVEKGELGDCLYVIASGRMRVHDGDRTFQQLGTHQVFGELSLLDARPRAASVTAVERTRLFRLGQGDFYALLSERPDMTRAINRALCAMVRAANAASSGAGSELDPARADARHVALEIE